MSAEERDNWIKIKKALEKADKKDYFYYKRACSLLDGKSDPLDRLKQ